MPERKITYDRFQEKAHSGILVKAPSWERLYIDGALALTDVMARLDAIEASDKHRLTVTGTNSQNLMLNWLNEILKVFESKKFVSRRIVFDKFDGKSITATLSGEGYVPLKHGLAPEIKPFDASRLAFGDGQTPEPYFFVKIQLSS
jgi:SHS2 domain-containing protein